MPMKLRVLLRAVGPCLHVHVHDWRFWQPSAAHDLWTKWLRDWVFYLI